MKQSKTILQASEDFFSRAEKINPKRESLTPELLRKFPGCEHYTEQEAEEVIKSLETLALIVFENAEIESICIDNQQVVDLDNGGDAKVIPIKPQTTKKRAA